MKHSINKSLDFRKHANKRMLSRTNIIDSGIQHDISLSHHTSLFFWMMFLSRWSIHSYPFPSLKHVRTIQDNFKAHSKVISEYISLFKTVFKPIQKQWLKCVKAPSKSYIWLLVGGFNPSEKYEFVTWDDDIPNINGKIKVMFQTTNQIMFHAWISHPFKHDLLPPAAKGSARTDDCLKGRNQGLTWIERLVSKGVRY